MSDFKAKMHQIRFRLGLHPRPRWGSLQPCPRHPSWITGGLLLRGGKGGEGKEEKEKRGKGRDEDVCKGHPRSLEMTTFDTMHTSSYWSSIAMTTILGTF